MTTKIISIVVPCYLIPAGGNIHPENELLHLTERCVNSLRQHCDAELVIIDNGSITGAEYLSSVADVYYRFSTNRGYAAAINTGFEIASGHWLVACNNDIELLDDWPSMAIGAWDHLTGAISSHLIDHDPQRLMGRELSGVGSMFGSLWMTNREIWSVVGKLDDGYGLGMYEDKDYWWRIGQYGLEMAKVGHCRHAGNATWGKLQYQQEIFLANRARYEGKWGK